MMKNQKAVIFDLDGTLIDSRADLALAVNLTRADLGLPPLPESVVTGFVGNGITKLLERALHGEQVEIPLAQAVKLAARHYKEHLLDNTYLYDGVEDMLQQLVDAGFILSVVTNKPAEPAQSILQGLNLAGKFTAVVGGDSCPELKPAAAPVHLALELCAAVADSSWIVGDNWTDLVAGRNAGLKSCFCKYGFGSSNGEAYAAVAENAGQIPRCIIEKTQT